MNIVAIVLACLLVLVCLGTAIADFRADPKALAVTDRLQIPRSAVRTLGVVKSVLTVGLLIGIVVGAVAFVTGVSLVFYFLFAIVAHVRVRDSLANIAPAFICCVASSLYVLISVAS